MGMFGFLKKKNDAVPSAPDTPQNVPGNAPQPAPAMDLPEIKLDGMDQPPSPDTYSEPSGLNQQLPPQPSMEDVQPDYDAMQGIQPPDQPNLQESLQQLPSEDAFSDSLFPNEEDTLQKPEETGPNSPAESLDSFAPDTEESVEAPKMPEKAAKAKLHDFEQLNQEMKMPEQPEEHPQEKPEEQPEIEPIEPQDFDEPVNVDETLPGAPNPEITEPEIEEESVQQQYQEAVKDTSEEFDEDVYNAEPAPSLLTPERRVVNQALFINVDHFKNIADIINGLSDDAKGAEETLFRIKDVVLGREKVFDKWQNDLEQVERELIQLDKLLFNV